MMQLYKILRYLSGLACVMVAIILLKMLIAGVFNEPDVKLWGVGVIITMLIAGFECLHGVKE